ncbi:MAG: bifunctional metallophosphatase/5'-nucleotidase [Coprobacillaceae bacterium]
MRKITKRFLSIFIALAVFIMPMMANVSSVFADTSTVITIFHTNDMHGSVENLSYVKTMKATTANSILVDAGDAAQGSTLATYTNGKGIIELMNTVGYDGMTLGNHEFDYGSAATLDIASTANFPVVSANVLNKDGNLLLDGIDGSNGQYFIKTVNGVKIGFFGITTTETAYKSNPGKLDGVTFEDEVEYSRQQVTALEAEGVDVIVGLVHVGIDATSDPTSHKIAQQVEGIDLLIDGHSHSQDQTTIGGTRIVQTGTKLANVGEVKVTVNDTTKDVEGITSQLVDATTYKANYIADADYAALYTSKNADLAPILNEVVSHTDTKIFTFDHNGTRVSRLEETPGGSLVADAMRYEGSQMLSDLGYNYPVVSLQNGGGCRADIEAGDITVGDILDILPFGNLISIKEITPDVLYDALENGYKGMEVKEDGYLDVSLANGGFAQISGMRAVIDASQPEGSKVKEIYLVNDTARSEVLLDRNDTTTTIALVSNDFEIAGGDGYTMLTNLNHIAEGGALDVVLQNYIKDHTVNNEFTYASTHGRIKVQQIEAIQNTGYVDIVPNITLTPNTNYNVTVDGITTVALTTDDSGNFTLEKLTNGAHTISVDGSDYYVSTYTNVGLLSLEVVAAPVTVTPDPDPNPVTPTTPITPTSPSVGGNVETGDDTAILGFIFMSAISGGYLVLQRRKYN